MPALLHDALLSPCALAAAVTGYVLGSLPFGYWVGSSHGVNMFEVGSRNPGATNVRRVLGRGPGNLVFALDALKGAISSGWPLYFVWRAHVSALSPNSSVDVHAVDEVARQLAGVWGAIGLAFAVLGHSFSFFTRFRGGKGVATVSGGLLLLMPAAVAVSAGVWVAVFYSSRYVSLASIAAAVVLPLAAGLFGLGGAAVAIAGALSLFIIFRHRANVGRLLNGTENRFARKTDPQVRPDIDPSHR